MAKKKNHPPVKKLRIGPYVFDLVPSHDLFVEVGKEGGSLVGRFLMEDQKILYDEEQSETCLKDTLIHESSHGIWSQTALDFLHEDDDPGSPGEIIISTFSPRLLEFIRDNKRFVQWLMEN